MIHAHASIGECSCDDVHGHGKLMDLEEAVARAQALCRRAGDSEIVSLANACGRVLASTCHAPEAMPFFDNSAMDGYAIRLDDLLDAGDEGLPVWGEASAGETMQHALVAGSCMRINTGARIPRGADCVVPREKAVQRGARLHVAYIPKRGANIRIAGSDIARNAILVSEGERIAPRHVGLLAANGYRAINVVRNPRVAVFSTGNEVILPGATRQPGQLYDANRPMLLAAFAELGCDTTDVGVVGDDPVATRRFIEANTGKFDLLVSTGSVSVGGRDYLKDVMTAAGGVIEAWRVAIKPGKPVMFGKIGNTVFLGLPGNPYAAWTGFQLFAKPIADVLAGTRPQPLGTMSAIAGCNFAHHAGRTEYVPVRTREQEGKLLVERLGNGGSASMFAAASADGIAVMPATAGDVPMGQPVIYIPFVRREIS